MTHMLQAMRQASADAYATSTCLRRCLARATNERTYELTKNLKDVVGYLTVADAREGHAMIDEEREPELTARQIRKRINAEQEAEALAALRDIEARRRTEPAAVTPEVIGPGGRWRVTRTGPRDDIDPVVRVAVYARDGHMCTICRRSIDRGTPERPTKHLDHIMPWSAGGSDHSSNLRTTCPPCNEQRSNYADGAKQMRPVTLWCTDCWTEETYKPGQFSPATLSRIGREGVDLIETPIHVELVLAYCAFCRTDGYTPSDRTL